MDRSILLALSFAVLGWVLGWTSGFLCFRPVGRPFRASRDGTTAVPKGLEPRGHGHARGCPVCGHRPPIAGRRCLRCGLYVEGGDAS